MYDVKHTRYVHELLAGILPRVLWYATVIQAMERRLKIRVTHGWVFLRELRKELPLYSAKSLLHYDYFEFFFLFTLFWRSYVQFALTFAEIRDTSLGQVDLEKSKNKSDLDRHIFHAGHI